MEEIKKTLGNNQQKPVIDSELKMLMTKFRILFINGKRYYEFDMRTKTPVLDNAVPFYFRYGNIEIYESSWNKMAVKIVEELDKINPRSERSLLRLEYKWNNKKVFSSSPQKNYTPYKNIYLNTNHSATHSMMSIQCLIQFFSISLSKCYFLVRKHPKAEPYQVRIYFKDKMVDNFKKCLSFRGFSEKSIDTIVNNVNYINSRFLSVVSQGFDDFFLFDDYYYFLSYKQKVIQKAKEAFFYKEQILEATIKTLDRLDEYYKNKDFYDSVVNVKIDGHFKTTLREEMDFLFESLHTSVIKIEKLYVRMSIVHKELLEKLGEFNNQSDLYRFVTAFFEKSFYYKKPFISKDKNMKLGNEDIIISYAYDQDEITITMLNNYCNKMHLKKLNNYLSFLIDISNDYVQVDQETAIKKELLNLNKDTLNIIEKELIYYVKSFGPINSENYSGYLSLPQINKEWNKYLLLGIVRTYLKKPFKIDYSEGTYKTFTYSISLL